MNYLRSNRGFTLVELLVTLSIIAVIMTGVMNLLKAGNRLQDRKVVASQMEEIVKASKSYVKQNYVPIQTLLATPGVGYVTMTVADLIGGDHLLATFQANNPWRQGFEAYVYEPSPGKLEILVLTTGGQVYNPVGPDLEFFEIEVPATAKRLGAKGGFIPTGTVPGELQSTVQGVSGGWSLLLDNANPLTPPNPGPGHLAAVVYMLAEEYSGGDYLYRSAVPGSPELNEMVTQLRMSDNSIAGIHSVAFETHTLAEIPCDGTNDGTVYFNDTEGLYMCRGGVRHQIEDTGNNVMIKDLFIATPGQVVNKPTCPVEVPNPRIYLAVAKTSQNATYKTIKAIETWATDNGATWTVSMRVQTRDGWMTPTATYGRMTATVSCEP